MKTKNLGFKIWLAMMLTLLTTVFAPNLAAASGGFLAGSGTIAQHDKMSAIIVHDGVNRETMITRLEFQLSGNGSQNIGWIMAVPSKPKVSTISPNVFTRFREASTPKTNYLTELFGNSSFKKASPTPTDSTNKPPAITQSKVGIYDITIVSAYEQQTIKEWGAKNSFNLNVLYTPALRDYVTAGWYFVIARVSPDKGTKIQAGISQPISFTFDTPEVIYPWRMAAYGTDGAVTTGRLIDTEIYLLKPNTRLAPQVARSELRETYAENLSEEDGYSLLQGIDTAASLRYFLTSYEGVVDTRNIEEADLKFSNANDQIEFNNGKLNGTDWLWAGVATLFYGPLALFTTLWALFTSSGTGLIIALLFFVVIYAFLKAEKTRPITALVLTITGGLLSVGITIGAVVTGTPAPALISIFVTGVLSVWAISHNLPYIRLNQPQEE